MKLAWWSWASGYQTNLSLCFVGKTTTRLIWCGKNSTVRQKIVARQFLGNSIGSGRWPDPVFGPRPQYGWDFPEEIRKNSRKTPETLSERFLEFPSRVRLGCPKPYNSRRMRFPERFQNSFPPSTAGGASFFRSGSGEGLSELVMEFPAVLRVFLHISIKRNRKKYPEPEILDSQKIPPNTPKIPDALSRVFGEGVRLQYPAAATTLETCLEPPFTQPIANKLLHSKQQKECNSSSTIASYCVA